MAGARRAPREIVGVIANARTAELAEPPNAEVYFPLWQMLAFSKHLVIRSVVDPRLMAAAVQRELRAVDPTVGVEHVKTMEQIRADSGGHAHVRHAAANGICGRGSVLTLIGIYGVLSLSVGGFAPKTPRDRDTLGARGDRGDPPQSGAGGGIPARCGWRGGYGSGADLSRALKSFLFGVESADAPTLLGVGVLFAVVALLAFWAPAMRAAKVDPRRGFAIRMTRWLAGDELERQSYRAGDLTTAL